MPDLSEISFIAFPFTLELPEGKLEIFDKRGFDRQGYAAYLTDSPCNFPRIGIGNTPLVAVMDVFTERT